MADSVNRIVPPSVALDRAAQNGREGKRKTNDGTRQKRRDEKLDAAELPAKPNADDNKQAADEEKTKGKNLDVSA